jgi:hypothetical protein
MNNAVISLHDQRLLRLARQHQITDAREARGRCLSASLSFAAAAQAQGLGIDLIRWDVVDDPAYLDHWALRLASGTVIDLTRVQVDGKSGINWTQADYPAAVYRHPQVYPSQLFLRGAMVPGTQDGRLPMQFLFGVGWARFRFDAARALRALALGDLGRATRSTARFFIGFCLQRALCAMENRLARQLRSMTQVPALRAQPEFRHAVQAHARVRHR